MNDLGSYLHNLTVREVMSPGVLTIVEDASMHQAFRALSHHRTHAILVLGRDQGRPLGWVTSRGLLGWLDCDPGLAPLREAITEQPVTISPAADAYEAWMALAKVGVSHLLVTLHEDHLPEGVVADLDLLRVAAEPGG